MDRRTTEAVRYLGFGKHAVDDQTLSLIAGSFTELKAVAGERFVYRIFELKSDGGNRLKIGTLEIESGNLSKNLKGCQQVIVFGATLGTGVDRLMKRRAVTDMAGAVVLQACAAAMLEEYCDKCQAELAEELERKGKYLRPRFSPGYGDFSIEHQGAILRMLDSAKKIGLSVTGSSMLTPTKSVTAVIGISDTKTPCHREGCEVCDKLDCLYRRS